MNTIPLQPVPSQTLSTTLNGQTVTLSIYTLDTPGAVFAPIGVTADSTTVTADSTTVTADATLALPTSLQEPVEAVYIDVMLNGSPLITGRLVQNGIPLLLISQYLGFEGELLFVDTQNVGLQNGTAPTWEGLGTQYQLIYLSPADLAAAA